MRICIPSANIGFETKEICVLHIVHLLNAVAMSLLADGLNFALNFVKLVKCIPSRMQSDSEAYFCASQASPLLPQKMEEFGELFRTE